MLSFDGQVAIVTGAGGGLGRAYAHLLADRGARVVVNDPGGSVTGGSGGATLAQAVVDEIRSRGGEAVANTDSVATPEGGEAIVKTAMDTFGSLEILINNAGILRDKAFHNMTPAEVDAVLDVHLRGHFHVTIPAWKHMRASAYGRIVNTASNSGILGNFGQANYGAAKTGVIGLTRVLSVEGASRGIKVNVVAPAARTRMTEGLLDPEIAALLDPESVAPAVVWLAHRDCSVTGEVFSVGGGRVARFFTGLTPGYFHPELTPELVAANIERIRRPDGFTIPDAPVEELELLKAQVAAYAGSMTSDDGSGPA